MDISEALQGMFMLLLLIGAGFLAARRDLLDETIEEHLSRLTIQMAIPALLFVNTVSYVSTVFLREIGWLALIPPASILLAYGLGLAATGLLRIPKEDTGVFVVMFALSNTMFIGLPVCLAIFGEAATPYVMTYYPANTAIFWTLGNLHIARDGGRRPNRPKEVCKQIFSPPVLGFLLGLAVVFAGLSVPDFMIKGLSYLGGLTVPVSLLTTGAVLSRMGAGAFRVGRAGITALAGRMLILPGLTLTLCLLFGAPAMLTDVFTLLACMPVMNQCVIMARLHGANHRLAAQMLTLSVLLALVWIPLWVVVLNVVRG